MNEVLIYQDIGPSFWGEGITAEAVKAELDEIGEVEEITVRINSVGGDVFHGAAIYNILREHPARIVVRVDALAASAASVVAMAGDEIHVAENALVMIHNPYTMAVGDAEEIRKTADLLDKVKGTIVSTYQRHTDKDADELSAMMDAETWLTAEEAIEAGLATHVAGATDEPVENAARPWIQNGPRPTEAIAPVDEPAPEPAEPAETTAPEPTAPAQRMAARTRLLELEADA